MSRYFSEEVEYDCGNDHGQMQPCTGHKLKLEFNASTDTVTLWVDGERMLTMDDGMYVALAKAMKA